jgi:hypothetical protein
LLFSLLFFLFFDFANHNTIAPEVNKLPFIDSTLKINSNLLSYTVHLKSFGKFGYAMQVKVSGNNLIPTEYAITIPYSVYHFELGDIDNDGIPDILLGVIKTTHFHPEMAKRLFIYKIDNGRIRPMWLGSKISHEIVDFRFISVKKKSFVKSIEKEQNNTYLVAEYKWKGFGLALVKYICRYTNKDQAYETFSN